MVGAVRPRPRPSGLPLTKVRSRLHAPQDVVHAPHDVRSAAGHFPNSRTDPSGDEGMSTAARDPGRATMLRPRHATPATSAASRA
jgi:hypothetical protein